MTQGYVFNIQRFSVHDGPGIRSTVFLKGCPLSCSWCHNPEGIDPGPELVLSPRRCIACGECLVVCPRDLPAPTDQRYPGLPDSCLVCGACAEVCPTQARQLAGERMSVDQVMAEVLKDLIFFEESDGGVTFSGGEPLSQPRFLRRLLAASRHQGVHTAVDTSGLTPWRELESVADLTDLFLYDVKALDDDTHRLWTGVSNESILSNLRRLGAVHPRIWVRVPVVPGVNDAPDHLQAIGRLAAGLSGVERVCLLPYHPLGEDKRRRQGRLADRQAASRPPSTALQELVDLVATTGVTAALGG
jgi:pyruvate formate lyase activating enzyme